MNDYSVSGSIGARVLVRAVSRVVHQAALTLEDIGRRKQVRDAAVHPGRENRKVVVGKEDGKEDGTMMGLMMIDGELTVG